MFEFTIVGRGVGEHRFPRSRLFSFEEKKGDTALLHPLKRDPNPACSPQRARSRRRRPGGQGARGAPPSSVRQRQHAAHAHAHAHAHATGHWGWDARISTAAARGCCIRHSPSSRLARPQAPIHEPTPSAKTRPQPQPPACSLQQLAACPCPLQPTAGAAHGAQQAAGAGGQGGHFRAAPPCGSIRH
jgi:hypothetical protein